MMTEECRLIEAIVSQWENDGVLSDEERTFIEEHCSHCIECASRYDRLLPFIRRDTATDTAKNDTFGSSTMPRLSHLYEANDRDVRASTDAVMEHLAAKRPVSEHAGKVVKILAIAASFIFATALMFKILMPIEEHDGLPSNGEQAGSSQMVKTPTNGTRIEVHFTLTAPDAHSVSLVGDFTEWDISKIRLQDKDNDGVWEASVRLKKNTVYLYNFVIDGEEWIVDPQSIISVDDGFGGESSLLKL